VIAMFKVRIDITGQQFGDLTVIKLSDKLNSQQVNLWECQCVCGKVVYLSASQLRSGNNKSCGCTESKWRSVSAKKSMEPQIVDNTRVSTLTAKIHKDNKSGYKGINWDNKRSKWRVTIGINKKQYHLGYFDKLDDAVMTRKKAEEIYHKPYLI
jgi:hypothetical protein